MSEIVKKFGQRVKFHRNKKRLSQEKLAELCELHPTYIGQVERGEKNCTLESAEKIAKGLGVPLEELLNKTAELNEEERTINDIYNIVATLDEDHRKKLLDIIRMINDFR